MIVFSAEGTTAEESWTVLGLNRQSRSLSPPCHSPLCSFKQAPSVSCLLFHICKMGRTPHRVVKISRVRANVCWVLTSQSGWQHLFSQLRKQGPKVWEQIRQQGQNSVPQTVSLGFFAIHPHSLPPVSLREDKGQTECLKTTNLESSWLFLYHGETMALHRGLWEVHYCLTGWSMNLRLLQIWES